MAMREISKKTSIVLSFLLPALVLVTFFFVNSHNSHEPLNSREVKLTYGFVVEEIPKESKSIRVWVPLPLSNAHQSVAVIEVRGDRSYRIVEETEYGNRFIVFDIAGSAVSQAGKVEVSIDYDIVRSAISSMHEHGEQLNADQLARYLGPSRLIPIDGKIAQEAYQTAGAVDNPFKQARLLYDHIVESLTYDKSGIGWGRGDAIYACDIRKGNCTDFHSLFIGQARSLNIPARFIMGIPLPTNRNQGQIPGYHCWGEFYIEQKGWQPIDASEASKFPEKKDSLFAALDEHRVAFTVGRDINLPGANSEPLNYVIYPHVEIDGEIHINVRTNFYFKDYR
ncbi:transglutaminase-like domain-containing protein [Planctomycetota bacterium]